MQTAEDIFEAIMADPDNEQFTAAGIEPLYHVEPAATIMIVSQAPSRQAQLARTYWHDPSGDRLRQWMGVSDDEFYHSGKIAVVPLDFYYPGKGKSGDLPPRKGFADKWHEPLFALMPHVQLTLLIGAYAQRYYLPQRQRTLTATVQHYADYAPYFPLVHPSPLNYGWLHKNSWFEQDVVPALQQQVRSLLQ
ncbi:uracil-DNA glycosylase family protein [Lacticaseibacillus pantheris]|uniref:Uracil-DNA glycosylase n=1 Tax=Lacticaseibacillus pantheris DSM 15945 = JCM 12539 = NBRC 106106 TaxID=1423783 RepID=A0A0R1U039_9LACO|nr:uracil-DNA glycosylase family protein [Lacticaseibacillus pantheris]KRL86694.1 uracil-DNA glycosylase [Lacticaseibacillus pantheris DSM 15945 = JCM 12539 = NBRC 106106]WKF85018.1 uracil-DNA glycosylase family protein [Lacticaseibacillus pantheris]